MSRRKTRQQQVEQLSPLEDAQQTVKTLREVVRWQVGLLDRLESVLTRLEQREPLHRPRS